MPSHCKILRRIMNWASLNPFGVNGIRNRIPAVSPSVCEFLRWLKCRLLLPRIWAIVAAAGLIQCSVGQAAPADYPRISQGTKTRGEAALRRLGNQLPEVANYHGKSASEMRAIFRRDPRLWVAKDGELDYVCAIDPLPAHHELEEAEMAHVEEAIPLEDTFFLHSRPQATRVIYLDFDGHVTTGMHWNSSYNNGEDIVTPPYSTDGNVSSFSTTELQNIQHMWQRVAEDFAPFDVDVTTQDPGVEGLRRTSTTDVYYGIRVCIGGSSTEWYGSAGGVAGLSSFRSGLDSPCFVFPAQLGNGNKKYVADAISHEVGHTLGLHHDGVTGGTSYYGGHGDWAPIMGAGYYTDLGQWSKGEYPSANNTEDDLAIIGTFISYRIDDHGNVVSQATSLVGANILAHGVIETTTDVDVFSFQTGAGTVAITADGAPPSPNLDIMLRLYDGNNNVVASSDPPSLEASLTLALNAGTYYLSVTGVGAGNLTTGYSDYGSLGEYDLTIAAHPFSRPSAPTGLAIRDAAAPLAINGLQIFAPNGKPRLR